MLLLPLIPTLLMGAVLLWSMKRKGNRKVWLVAMGVGAVVGLVFGPSFWSGAYVLNPLSYPAGLGILLWNWTVSFLFHELSHALTYRVSTTYMVTVPASVIIHAVFYGFVFGHLRLWYQSHPRPPIWKNPGAWVLAAGTVPAVYLYTILVYLRVYLLA